MLSLCVMSTVNTFKVHCAIQITCMFLHVSLFMCVLACTPTYVYMCLHVCVCVYLCVCVCIHLCVPVIKGFIVSVYFIQIYITLTFSMVGKYRYVSFSNTEITVNLQKYLLLKYSTSFQSIGIFRALSICLDAA